MRNPNGFEGLVVSDYGSTFWFENPDVPGSVRNPTLTLTDKKGEELSFLDAYQFMTEGNSTDTKKEIVIYFTSFGTLDGAVSLKMEFAVAKEHDPDAHLFTDVCDVESVVISIGHLVAAQSLTSSEGWTVSVSPMGLVLTPPDGHDFGINYGPDDFVIHFSDGIDYIVKCSDPYTDNTTVDCFSSEGAIHYAFNRIIDPAAVESITVTGKIWNAKANETPFTLTFAK